MPLMYSLPSVNEADRYQDYQVAIDHVYKALTNESSDPLANPFDKNELPQRHGVYKAILENGAIICYNFYHLNGSSFDRYVQDVIRNDRDLQNVRSKNLPTRHLEAGSDDYFNALQKYRSKRPYLKKSESAAAFFKDYIVNKRNWQQALQDEDDLARVGPLIIALAHTEDSPIDFHTRSHAVQIDSILGFLDESRLVTRKKTDAPLGLSLKKYPASPKLEGKNFLMQMEQKISSLRF